MHSISRSFIFFILSPLVLGGGYGIRSKLEGICENVSRKFEILNGEWQYTYPERLQYSMTEIEPIGSGAFGKVYKGKLNGKFIAIKRMEINDSNAAEIKYLKELQGTPGIADFIFCEIGDESIYLYQTLLYADMKQNFIKQQMQRLKFLAKLKLYRSLTSTLIKIHEKRIIHSDIKPANIMTDSPELEKLFIIDFGLAHAPNQPGRVGTPLYWSPEILKSKYHSPNEKDDVFALAMTIINLDNNGTYDLDTKQGLCKTIYQNEFCYKHFTNFISNSFKTNYQEHSNECGSNSVFGFQFGIERSLKYYADRRYSPADLLNSLETSIRDCESFQRHKRVERIQTEPTYTNRKIMSTIRPTSNPGVKELQKSRKTRILELIANLKNINIKKNDDNNRFISETKSKDTNFMFAESSPQELINGEIGNEEIRDKKEFLVLVEKEFQKPPRFTLNSNKDNGKVGKTLDDLQKNVEISRIEELSEREVISNKITNEDSNHDEIIIQNEQKDDIDIDNWKEVESALVPAENQPNGLKNNINECKQPIDNINLKEEDLLNEVVPENEKLSNIPEKDNETYPSSIQKSQDVLNSLDEQILPTSEIMESNSNPSEHENAQLDLIGHALPKELIKVPDLLNEIPSNYGNTEARSFIKSRKQLLGHNAHENNENAFKNPNGHFKRTQNLTPKGPSKLNKKPDYYLNMATALLEKYSNNNLKFPTGQANKRVGKENMNKAHETADRILNERMRKINEKKPAGAGAEAQHQLSLIAENPTLI
jgi:serine/threonine protein kinase